MNALTQVVLDEKKSEIQHKIANWINNLAFLTKKSDRNIEERWVFTLTNALMDEFQSWYFCKSSMHYIAKKYEFFPSFKEIFDSLKEWVEVEKNRRNLVNTDQNEYETDRFKSLSETDQMLVRTFRINQSKKWRLYAVNGDIESEEKNPPSIDVQIERENKRAKLLHDTHYEAWAYLFPKEAQEEQKSKDYSKDYTEDNIYNWVKKIYSDPRDKYTDVRLRFIADGIRRYSPHLLDFFEKLNLEMQEKTV